MISKKGYEYGNPRKPDPAPWSETVRMHRWLLNLQLLFLFNGFSIIEWKNCKKVVCGILYFSITHTSRICMILYNVLV